MQSYRSYSWLIKYINMSSYPTFRYYYSGGSGSPSVDDGKLLIGNSNGIPILANLQAGTGISVTNGPGSIVVANTAATIVGGNCISVDSGPGSTTISLVDKPWGEIWSSGNAVATVVAGASIPLKAVTAATILHPDAYLFSSPLVGRLQYNGVEERVMHCGATFDMTADDKERTWRVSIFKNGLVVPGAQTMNFLGFNNGATFTGTIHKFIRMNAGDYLEIFMENNDDDKPAIMQSTNLFAMATPNVL